jgi:uncharacterized protein YndB with AHSA1/START domain
MQRSFRTGATLLRRRCAVVFRLVSQGTPYQFVTRWSVDGPIGPVWEAIKNAEAYPRWWKAVLAVEQLEPGDAAGIGRVDRFTWRAPLGYKLRFTLRLTTIEEPNRLGGDAGGDLEGRGDWTLRESDGVTHVRYEWRVRTNRAWMNALAPVARPVFKHSHDVVMREGAVGLARLLGVRVTDLRS